MLVRCAWLPSSTVHLTMHRETNCKQLQLSPGASNLQVLYNIARSVSELHASGFVHRDIQPSNVIKLAHENRWSVISFRRTVRAGSSARVRYSLAYAAPEAVSADVNGKRHMLVTPALDSWSLGILAMELFTGKAVFDSSMSDHDVRFMFDACPQCTTFAPATGYIKLDTHSQRVWL